MLVRYRSSDRGGSVVIIKKSRVEVAKLCIMAQIAKLCDARIDALPAKREGEAELESQKSTPSAVSSLHSFI